MAIDFDPLSAFVLTRKGVGWNGKALASYFIISLSAASIKRMWKTFLSTLKPAGEVADKQYDLTVLSTLIMVVVVAVVSVIFFYVIVRFRRSRVGENTIPKQVEGNKFLEITWTVIPILLLIILVIPVVLYTLELADTSPMDKKAAKLRMLL